MAPHRMIGRLTKPKPEEFGLSEELVAQLSSTRNKLDIQRFKISLCLGIGIWLAALIFTAYDSTNEFDWGGFLSMLILFGLIPLWLLPVGLVYGGSYYIAPDPPSYKQLAQYQDALRQYEAQNIAATKKALSSKEGREAIIQAYGKVLAPSSAKRPFAMARRESDLPFSKSIIRQAIIQALLDEPEEQYRNTLEGGYVGLEFFVPDEEYTQATIFHDIATRVTEGDINVRESLDEMSRLNYMPELDRESSRKITQRMARSQQELEALKKMVAQAHNHERVKGGLSRERKQQLWEQMEQELSFHEFLPCKTAEKRGSATPPDWIVGIMPKVGSRSFISPCETNFGLGPFAKSGWSKVVCTYDLPLQVRSPLRFG